MHRLEFEDTILKAPTRLPGDGLGSLRPCWQALYSALYSGGTVVQAGTPVDPHQPAGEWGLCIPAFPRLWLLLGVITSQEQRQGGRACGGPWCRQAHQ